MFSKVCVCIVVVLAASACLAEDAKPAEKGKEPGVEFTGVSPHMMKTLGLSVIRGRELTDTESMTKTPYAVINQAMADIGHAS